MADLEELQNTIDELTEKLNQENIIRNNHIKQYGASTDQLDGSIKSLKDQIKNLTRQLTEQQQAFKQVIESSKSSFLTFKDALSNTSNDISKFSPSVTSLIKGTGAAAETIASMSSAGMKFIPAIQLTTIALEAFAESLIKYTANVVKTFDSVATIGLAAGLTSEELARLGRESRFSGDDLVVFGNLLAKQGGNLVAFGGSVSGGAEKFAEFIDVGADQLNKYRKLGISQIQLAEYQGWYADNLLKSGVSISRNDEAQRKLRDESLKYRDILYSLSTITGETLEEQQKAQDFARSQSNFNAMMAQRSIDILNMEKQAETMAEGAEKDELNARIASFKTQTEMMRMFSSLADPAKVGIDNATGMIESLSAGGDTMSESIAKMAMMGFDVNNLVQRIMTFSGTTEEGSHLIAEGMKEYTTAVDAFIVRSGDMATSFGIVSQEYLSSVAGISNESIAFAARLREIPLEEIFNTLEENVPDDALMTLQAESEELSANFRILKDTISDFASTTMAKFGTSIFETANFIFDKVTGEETTNQPSFTGGAALGALGATGIILSFLTALKAPGLISSAAGLFRRGTTATTTATLGTPTTATPRTTSPTPPGYTTSPGGILVPNQPSSVRPAGTAATVATASRWSKFVAWASVKNPSLMAKLGGKLALMAGLLAVPGPGWIGALINLGLNAWTAWTVYQLWKEFSGGSDVTEEDSLNENSIPVTGMGGAANELAQSLAVLTGTDTEIGTVPRLTNSFDSLINATNLLTMSFSNLSNLTSNRNTPSNNLGSMTEQQIKDYIIQNEGIRYDPYLDTEGNWTVGVGHNLGKQLSPEMNRTFTHQEVMELFEQDYREHRTAAERIPGFNSMDSSGQMALIDMTFNMGPSWIRKWPELQNQLAMEDTTSAANNIRSSLYYNQVGSRGERNAQLLQSARPDFGTIDSNTYLTAVADNSSANTQTSDGSTVSKLNEVLSINRTLMEMLNSKMDNMIGKLDESNYIQGRILSNTV